MSDHTRNVSSRVKKQLCPVEGSRYSVNGRKKMMRMDFEEDYTKRLQSHMKLMEDEFNIHLKFIKRLIKDLSKATAATRHHKQILATNVGVMPKQLSLKQTHIQINPHSSGRSSKYEANPVHSKTDEFWDQNEEIYATFRPKLGEGSKIEESIYLDVEQQVQTDLKEIEIIEQSIVKRPK